MPMPDYFEKVPFVWNEPQPIIHVPPRLIFQPIHALRDTNIVDLVSYVIQQSLDAADQHAVATHGTLRAASNFLAEVDDGFTYEPDWWQAAVTQDSKVVGFVLPVVFKDGRKAQREEGTIYYLGVLPEYRGHHYGYDLLCQAIRTLRAVAVWRIFCDTDRYNHPMINTFIKAGYVQAGAPYQRPL